MPGAVKALQKVFATALPWTRARGCGARRKSFARDLTFGFVAVFVSAGVFSRCQTSAIPERRLPVLTTAREVNGLTSEQASLGYAVRLRGIVTFYDPYQEGHKALFVADETGNIFVAPPIGRVLPLHPGSRVELSGVTDPGGYSPIVTNSVLRILPGSKQLPTPRAETISKLLTGTDIGQWVALRGTVHSVEFDGMHVELTIATEDGTLAAIADKEDGVNYSALVDSEVSIRGIAAPLVNSRRQLMGIRLLFPGMRTVTITKPAPSDPFLSQVRSISSLMQYSPHAESPHRIHLRGQVTLSWPGRTVCIVDNTAGLCIQTSDHIPLREGDLIDVAGFLGRENYIPTVTAATLKLVKSGGRVTPVAISAADAFKTAQSSRGAASKASHIDLAKANAFGTDYNGELVRIEGKLVGRNEGLNGSTFLFSSGGILFTVVPPPRATGINQQLESSLVDGSTIRATGVFVGRVDEQQTTRREGLVRLESFQILLRSPSDFTVLSVPSWWNSEHTLEVLVVLLLFMVVILAWAEVLRRQVHRQTEVIRQSEERFRHMAEHDGLTGLPVRNVLLERLEAALSDIRQQPNSLALLMVDVDGFKQLNDSLGHAVGDQVLCAIGNRLQESVRSTDTVARMGGDEFTVLIKGIRRNHEAQRIASQLVSNVSAPIVIDGRTVEVSVSVGVATYPENGSDVKTLLRSSDAALYQAKARGRNRYETYSADTAPLTFAGPFSGAAT
jgi:diguanylate cyclase (GGDEF)-like protein